MLSSFYLFVTPLLVACFYVLAKFFLHRKEIQDLENNAFSEDGSVDNLEVAKEKVFLFLENLRSAFEKTLLVFFHWLLHFFVLFLKFISDFTDVLYARSRDFFLKSVTKEKKAVTTFWHHLKEYKKEKEEEEENKE